AVCSIYGSRTLQWSADNSRAQTGLLDTRTDSDLRTFSPAGVLDGDGVTAAIIDTGVDAGHPDIAGRVVRNVKLADLQGLNPVAFTAPASGDGVTATAQLSGHGTFAGGLVAG